MWRAYVARLLKSKQHLRLSLLELTLQVDSEVQIKVLFNITECAIKGCCHCTKMHFADMQATSKVNNFQMLSQQRSLSKSKLFYTLIMSSKTNFWLLPFRMSKLSQPVKQHGQNQAGSDMPIIR